MLHFVVPTKLISTSTCGWLRKQLCQHFSVSFPFLQVVKDRVCLRALEKIIYQLADSKEQAEILSATALQPVDVNADGTCAHAHAHTLKKVDLHFFSSEFATDDLSQSAKKPKRGNTLLTLFRINLELFCNRVLGTLRSKKSLHGQRRKKEQEDRVIWGEVTVQSTQLCLNVPAVLTSVLFFLVMERMFQSHFLWCVPPAGPRLQL